MYIKYGSGSQDYTYSSGKRSLTSNLFIIRAFGYQTIARLRPVEGYIVGWPKARIINKYLKRVFSI